MTTRAERKENYKDTHPLLNCENCGKKYRKWQWREHWHKDCI